MPMYEYECLSCGKRTERLQRFDDAPLSACPACGGEVKKLISAPAVQFKGSGWYVTDYAGKGSAGRSDASSSKESKDTKESKESKSAESKPAPAAGGGGGGE
jgi:putative FmdB family regulatory protein